jgi:hypothetical protein
MHSVHLCPFHLAERHNTSEGIELQPPRAAYRNAANRSRVQTSL